MKRCVSIETWFLANVLVLLMATTASAQIVPGDIVVVDNDVDFDFDCPDSIHPCPPPPFGEGALFRVDPSTGARTLISDFSNPAQGPLGSDPLGMAVEASGMILVVDRGAMPGGALFRIDPSTGVRTVLSDFGNASLGPLGQQPYDVAIEASGQILVVDDFHDGVLFRVDPTTGVRTLLSDFANSLQGPLGTTPFGLGVEGSGMILVADNDSGSASQGALFRVDPSTGVRTVLSDFGNSSQGTLGICPSDVAVEASGSVLVADPCADSPDYGGRLFRVDPSTGVRTLLSNFGNASQGPLGFDPFGVEVEAFGTILVADPSAGATLGVLFRVDPSTGDRTVLSDFGNASQGPVGRNPFRVAIYRAAPPQDDISPSVTCAEPDGLWHAHDVTLSCTAEDGQSGLADPADASFTLSTSVPGGIETADAATSSRAVCDAANNCAMAGPIAGNMVDKRSPSVAISSPTSSTYMLNQGIAASYACTDGGSGIASCNGAVPSGTNFDTASVGAKTFAVSAADVVGNPATEFVSYSVGYGICLLYDPTKAHKSGSTLPLKIQLCDANEMNVSNAATIVTATGVFLVSTNAPGELEDSGNANPESNFRYSADLGGSGGYIFNLSLKGYGQGTYVLTFTAGDDPTTHSIQFEVR